MLGERSRQDQKVLRRPRKEVARPEVLVAVVCTGALEEVALLNSCTSSSCSHSSSCSPVKLSVAWGAWEVSEGLAVLEDLDLVEAWEDLAGWVDSVDSVDLAALEGGSGGLDKLSQPEEQGRGRRRTTSLRRRLRRRVGGEYGLRRRLAAS